ncbi:MAG: TRAP transporter small permease subunit [Gammaproteobacteria bacterium]|nr:TRAP transporter small permease subunit [Gammaproteobacteria bacterium]
MHTLIDKIEAFIDWSGRTVSWLTLLMVITTFIVVVLRYIFDIGWIGLQESITYLHATVFLVGAAWALQQQAHVRVDIFYSRFSVKTRAWIDLLGSLFFLLPVMIFIAWISWEYVSDSWAVLEGSREAGGLPGVYLLKSLILVSALMLMLQALVQISRSLQLIKSID